MTLARFQEYGQQDATALVGPMKRAIEGSALLSLLRSRSALGSEEIWRTNPDYWKATTALLVRLIANVQNLANEQNMP